MVECWRCTASDDLAEGGQNLAQGLQLRAELAVADQLLHLLLALKDVWLLTQQAREGILHGQH